MKIQAVNISKKYRSKVALDCVSFDSRLEILGVLGPNGAGKTTLFNILTSIMEPDSGDVLINDTSIASLGIEEKNNIGYFPQEFNIYKQLTGREVLEFFCSLKGVFGSRRKQEIERVTERFALEELLGVRFDNMSKGMKQKTGIASTMINDPELIIVDEPTSGLDPAERIRFRNYVSTMSEDKTIIFSTHIISDIEAICMNLLVLYKGKVLFMGKTSDLIERFRNYIFESELTGKECREIEKKYRVLRNISIGAGRFHTVIFSPEKVTQYDFCCKKDISVEDAYLSLMIENE